ncbi:MAG: glycosyltransferase family 39 protein [Kiritimatiellae bacterium]|nr:glycosyltransferase family 39 protein [Kiritimatiellia bacterium]
METKPVEVKIQDLIYNIDVGIGLRIVQTVLALLAMGFVVLWFTAVRFRGLKEAEAMELAQLGHNLLRHRSMITQCIRPGTMQFMEARGRRLSVERYPDTRHPPLYPALLAAVFAPARAAFSAGGARPGELFTPEQWCIVPLNHLFVALSAFFVFRIARRLFSARIARLTTIVFLLSRMMWEDSLSGLGLPVVWFFGLGAWYFLLRCTDAFGEEAAPRRGALFLVLAAVFAGAAALTRYAALALWAGMAAHLAFSLRRRVLAPAAFLAIALATISPWLYRNWRVTGTLWGDAPRTALYNSQLSEGDAIDRTMNSRLTFGAIRQAVTAKAVRRFTEIYRFELGRQGEGLLYPLFFATFLFRFVRRETRLFRWAVAIAMLSVLLVGTVFESAMRLFHIFWPIMAAYALAFFFVLLDRLQWQLRIAQIGATAGVVALSAIPFVAGLLPPAEGLPYPPYLPAFVKFVSGLLEPRETMCTDMPWATAWYGDRVSIYVPIALEEFYELNDYRVTEGIRIRGLYFTTLTRDLPFARVLLTGPYKNWFPILQGRLPTDFPLTAGLPLNNMDQLFLTDRVRWGGR